MSKPATTIAEFLDLDQWDVTEGVGCIDGPKWLQGRHTCEHCGTLYQFAPSESPLGLCWLTRKVEPRK